MLRAGPQTSSNSTPLPFNNGGQVRAAQPSVTLEQVPNNRANEGAGGARQGVTLERLNGDAASHPARFLPNTSVLAEIPIVPPLSLLPRARTRLQKVAHPFTPPTDGQQAAEAERRDLKRAIRTLKEGNFNLRLGQALIEAQATCDFDHHQSLTMTEFCLVWNTAAIANQEFARADREQAKSGKAHKHPWMKVEVLVEGCMMRSIDRTKAVAVLRAMVNNGLAEAALQRDARDQHILDPVMRLLALPPPFSEHTKTCAIV